MNVVITDKLQAYKDYEKYTLARDLILAALVYFVYKHIPSPAFFNLIYYYIIFILFRFALSHMTEIRKEDGKKYFALSGHVGLFTICVFMCLKYELFNKWIGLSMLLMYSIFTVLTKAHFTADVINTVAVIFCEITLLKRYFDVN